MVDAVGKDRDTEASILFEESVSKHRHPGPPPHRSNLQLQASNIYVAVSYTSVLTRQPTKGRVELHSGSKTPFWGLLQGFVADLMHVAGGREP